MGYFGRYDNDFDDENMSKRAIKERDLREVEDERVISYINSLEKDIKKMKKFLKKEKLYKKYKKRYKL